MPIKLWKNVAALAMGLGVLTQAHALPFTDDQANVGPTNFSGTNGELNGQSFTPTSDSIDAAEFFIRSDGGSSTLHLEVRVGQGLTGTLLGSSAQVTITSALTLVHFDLLSPVTLTPGALYTLVLDLDAGSTFAGEMSNLNPYAGGLAINNFGNTFPNLDFWFREGTHAAQVPVPPTLALLGLGLACAGWSRRRKSLAAV